jgi:hypothetical protein
MTVGIAVNAPSRLSQECALRHSHSPKQSPSDRNHGTVAAFSTYLIGLCILPARSARRLEWARGLPNETGAIIPQSSGECETATASERKAANQSSRSTMARPGKRHSLLFLQAFGRIVRGQAPTLSIDITKECPLRCAGCYAYEDAHLGMRNLRSLSDSKGEELIARVLGLMDQYKPLHLSIVGGDR